MFDLKEISIFAIEIKVDNKVLIRNKNQITKSNGKRNFGFEELQT